MKKILFLLLACLMAVNVSAQNAKKTTTKKNTTTKKTSSKVQTKKTSSKVQQGTLTPGTFFFNTNATNIGFNYFNVGPKGSKSSSDILRFGLQANGGYALMPSLAIVAGTGVQFGKMEESSITALNLMAGARYYIIHNLYASGMLVLGHANINAGGKMDDIDDEDLDLDPNMKGTTFGLDIGVGYSIFLTPKVAIEPNISYSIGLVNKFRGQDYKLNSLTLNIGFTFFL